MGSNRKHGHKKKKLTLIRKIKRYIRKEKRKDEIRRERYTAVQYAYYLKKKRKRNLAMAGVLAAFLLLVILLIFGIAHLIGWMVKGSSGGNAKETVAESIPTDNGEDSTEITSSAVGKEERTVFEEKTISLGSTGSISLHDAVLQSALREDGSYDFSECFQYIAPYFSGVDFMTCEFEGSLAGEENGYCGYPLFNAPDSIVPAMKDSGIDMVLLASNHVYDWVSTGFHRMMDVFDEDGLQYGGVRQSTSVPRYRVEDIEGIKVGFVDYVFEDENENEGTHTLNFNIINDEDTSLINTFNYNNLDGFYAEMQDNISGMKAEGAQFIVVEMHWGNEYELTETSGQDEIAQQLADMGVNALIGGHPYVQQPIDVVDAVDGSQMFVIYAQGNLLCNQRKEQVDEMNDGHTEDGIMITLSVSQDSEGNVSLTGVNMIPLWCCLYTDGNGDSHYYILPLDDVDNIESDTGLTGIAEEAKASYDRTIDEQSAGLAKAQAAFGGNE